MTHYESMHQTFNARNYSAEEVAKRFVSNRDFNALISNRHTVLLGPRGCGKTTLFKMLTLRGLFAWHSPEAKQLRRLIPFYAIYIPTDIVWKHQMEYANEHLEAAPKFGKASARAIIVTNILNALIATLKDVIELEKRINRPAETELCCKLIEAWHLPPCIPNLTAIEQELLMRVNEIRERLNRAVDFDLNDSELLSELPAYYFLDYLPAVEIACVMFSSLFKIRASRKWALCFDELELAPEWFQREVLTQLRSTAQRFLFKISSSPIPKILGDSEASQLHDFQLIRIWPHESKDYDDFCRSLSSQVLTARLGPGITPSAFFGVSPAYAKEDYQKDSYAWRTFTELLEFDEATRKLLADKDINLEDPLTMDVSKRDQVLRKLKPIAVYRHAYLKKGADGGIAKRTRNVFPEIFSGEHVIYRLCDGNPRFLIFLVERLAGAAQLKSDLSVEPLSAEKQAGILRQVSQEFCAHLRAVPKAIFHNGPTTLSMFDVIEQLGTYFHDQVCGNKVSLDPLTTFTVDSWMPNDVIEAFRRIVWHGGFVHVDPQDTQLDTVVHNKKFRLSYGLAPIFGTLLRSDKSKKLSMCSQIMADLNPKNLVSIRAESAVMDVQQMKLKLNN